ncbi:lysine transporter LysE, partial [Bacillus cereus]
SWLTNSLYIIGFFFLLYMGFVIWRSNPSNDVKQEKSMPLKKQILFAASVSLLNPHAILDTIGVIGTNSIQYIGNEKWAFTLATIIVSWIWFISLAVAGKFLKRLDSTGKTIVLLNKFSGLIIWGVALYMLKQVIYP